MKQVLFFIAVAFFTINSFGQFSDTTELNTYIRDTIKDRRPDKVIAAQVQKALLGVSSFLIPKYLTIDVEGNIFFDNYYLKSGEESEQYLTTDANGQLKLKTVTAPAPTITYPGSESQIFYKNSSGTIGASSDFTFDSTNRRLGIGIGTAGGSLDATLQIAGFSPPDQSTASGLSTNHLMRIYGANGGSTSYTSVSGIITGGNGGYIQVQSGPGGQNTGASTTARGGVGGLCQFGAGNGGNQTNSSAVNGTGGNGGNSQLYGGRGGTARGTGTVTGGVGGAFDIYAGDGGAAQGSTGTRTGGVGGRLYLQAGNGGSGANSGGIGGDVEIYSGSGGNGSVGGVAGNIYIYPGYTSLSYGNIYLGINKSGNIGGSVGIGTNSFVSGEKLRVNGNTLISGTLTSNSLTTSGAITAGAAISTTGSISATHLNMSSTLTPSSSSDGSGSTGDIRYDDDYIYIKTSTGWKRAALSTW